MTCSGMLHDQLMITVLQYPLNTARKNMGRSCFWLSGMLTDSHVKILAADRAKSFTIFPAKR